MIAGIRRRCVGLADYDSGRVARNITPSPMKTAPAIRRSQTGEMKRDTRPPASTAIAELVHNASAEPRKTVHFDVVPADMESVASCVLSPSSAMKTAPKMEMRDRQSMPFILGE